MQDIIDTLFTLNFRGFIYTLFVLMACIIAIYEITMKFVKMINEIRIKRNKQMVEANAVQDLEIGKIRSRVELIESDIKASKKSHQLIMRGILLKDGLAFLQRGSVTHEELNLWLLQWDCYHYDLGGNGDLDAIKKKICRLPFDIQVDTEGDEEE